MKVKFKYSTKENLRILYRIYKTPRDYTSLRSVVWNPVRAFTRKPDVEEISKRWKTIKKPHRELTKSLVCYVTSVGPEGMFEPDKKVIHARYDGDWDNFVETVMHEAAHIELYNKSTYEYEKDEDRVEKYISSLING